MEQTDDEIRIKNMNVKQRDSSQTVGEAKDDDHGREVWERNWMNLEDADYVDEHASAKIDRNDSEGFFVNSSKRLIS